MIGFYNCTCDNICSGRSDYQGYCVNNSCSFRSHIWHGDHRSDELYKLWLVLLHIPHIDLQSHGHDQPQTPIHQIILQMQHGNATHVSQQRVYIHGLPWQHGDLCALLIRESVNDEHYWVMVGSWSNVGGFEFPCSHLQSLWSTGQPLDIGWPHVWLSGGADTAWHAGGGRWIICTMNVCSLSITDSSPRLLFYSDQFIRSRDEMWMWWCCENVDNKWKHVGVSDCHNLIERNVGQTI